MGAFTAPELAAFGTHAIGVRTLQAVDRGRPDILNTKDGGPTVRYDRPLALTLHTAIRHRKPASYRRLADIAQRYGLELAPTLEVAAPDADGLAAAYRRWHDRLAAADL